MQPVQSCTHCGAQLSLDDLRKPNCPYCGTVYPHRAQAQQHAELVGQVVGQLMNQSLQAQDQYRGQVASQLPGIVQSSFGQGAPGSPQIHVVQMSASFHASPQVASHLLQTLPGTLAANQARKSARTALIVTMVVLALTLAVGVAAVAMFLI